jgi:hypothetical protein
MEVECFLVVWAGGLPLNLLANGGESTGDLSSRRCVVDVSTSSTCHTLVHEAFTDVLSVPRHFCRPSGQGGQGRRPLLASGQDWRAVPQWKRCDEAVVHG